MEGVAQVYSDLRGFLLGGRTVWLTPYECAQYGRWTPAWGGLPRGEASPLLGGREGGHMAGSQLVLPPSPLGQAWEPGHLSRREAQGRTL